MKFEKKYSEYDKLKALVVLDRNGENIRRTSLETGISRPTLSQWNQARKQSNESLEDRLERMAYQVLAMMPGKMKEADFQQLARGLVIIYDMIERAAAKEGRRATRSEVHEKLTRLLDQYAAENGTDEDPGSADGE